LTAAQHRWRFLELKLGALGARPGGRQLEGELKAIGHNQQIFADSQLHPFHPRPACDLQEHIERRLRHTHLVHLYVSSRCGILRRPRLCRAQILNRGDGYIDGALSFGAKADMTFLRVTQARGFTANQQDPLTGAPAHGSNEVQHKDGIHCVWVRATTIGRN
jgi:hypothetical protein